MNSHPTNTNTGIVALALGALCLLGEPAAADEAGLAGMSLVGINRDTGELWRCDLPGGEAEAIGTVEDTAGRSLRHLGATAWFEGFGGLHGFWREPATGRMQLVYVNLETAVARDEGVTLGPGLVHGAASAVVPDAEAPRGRRWRVFAMQEDLGLDVEGQTNINPNNSRASEFTLETPDGRRITRDDLHRGETDENGVYYSGPAAMVRLKPKGNGNRNGITLDGRVYPLRNGRTYFFESQPGAEPMQVVVYNTRSNNGNSRGNGNGNTPMGHWWVSLRAASATVGWEGPGAGGDRFHERPAVPRSRLVRVDTVTGVMEPVMELGREYAGLVCDKTGEVFHAVHDGDLYRIDPEAGTESRVSEAGVGEVVGLDRGEEGPVAVVRVSRQSVAGVDAEDGSWLSDAIDVGSAEAGAALLAPTEGLPSSESVAVD